MKDFETFGTIYLIVCLILAVIQIIMIIKFFQIASDVRILKNNSTQQKPDFNLEFGKWIAAQEPEKAKEVLINEIGNSVEFAQLLGDGNDKYKDELRKKIRTKYKAELDLLKLELVLEDWC